MNNKPASSKKSTITIIAIIIVAVIAYFYYTGTQTSPDAGSSLSTVSANDQAVGAQVLALLNQIQSLKIDTSLFKDPTYLTLRDYTVAIPSVPVGRDDPFAPLPGMASSSRSLGR